jgi:hypothetical protein
MRHLALLAIAVGLGAAELPMPPVPDPVGLGARLALIDELRAEGAELPEGADLERLKAIYWSRHGGVPGQVQAAGSDSVDDAALARDRIRRLRDELSRRHIQAPADADEDALVALLRAAREQDAGSTSAGGGEAGADDHAAPDVPERATATRPPAPVSGHVASDVPKRSTEPKRPSTPQAAPPTTEAKPTAAAQNSDGTPAQRAGSWRRKLGERIDQIAGIPLDVPAISPAGEMPWVTGPKPVKVLHSDGREERLDVLPSDGQGIASAWVAREAKLFWFTPPNSGAPAGTRLWVQMYFIPGAGWAEDPLPDRWSQEERLYDEWMAMLLAGPENDGWDTVNRWRVAREEAQRGTARALDARRHLDRDHPAGAERARLQKQLADSEQAAEHGQSEAERLLDERAAALGLAASPARCEHAGMAFTSAYAEMGLIQDFADEARALAVLAKSAASVEHARQVLSDQEATAGRVANALRERRTLMRAVLGSSP